MNNIPGTSFHITYEHRLIALLLFMGGMVIYDFVKNPPGQRQRWRNYGFILAAGLIGAAFGLGVDLCTSQISVDYFIHGKGITYDNSFMLNVMRLGLKAGFSAGAVTGCVFVVVNADKSRVDYLFPYLILPLLLAMFAGSVLGCFQFQTGWITQREVIAALGLFRAKYFTTVWMTHVGVYAGGLAGILIGCATIYSHSRH